MTLRALSTYEQHLFMEWHPGVVVAICPVHWGCDMCAVCWGCDMCTVRGDWDK